MQKGFIRKRKRCSANHPTKYKVDAEGIKLKQRQPQRDWHKRKQTNAKSDRAHKTRTQTRIQMVAKLKLDQTSTPITPKSVDLPRTPQMTWRFQVTSLVLPLLNIQVHPLLHPSGHGNPEGIDLQRGFAIRRWHHQVAPPCDSAEQNKRMR